MKNLARFTFKILLIDRGQFLPIVTTTILSESKVSTYLLNQCSSENLCILPTQLVEKKLYHTDLSGEVSGEAG